MSKILDKEKSKWVHPWNIEKFDNINNRDERFFSLVIKGALSYLTRNIVLYNKPIKHFIFNTGSSYMYVESNEYKFSWNETSGEDQLYMSRPRCVIELGDIVVNNEELTQPHIRGTYERYTENNNIAGFNAEFTRMPITISLNLTYILSNFNESIVLIQELIDKLLFQRYFTIIYLGQQIRCSLEFPNDFKAEFNKIDMTSTEQNNKSINITLNLCTNYPAFDDRTEISNQAIIGSFNAGMKLYKEQEDNITDTESMSIN
jgi:hypothetical protein